MANLNTTYSAEVDKVNIDSWYQILKQFADANIYQMWDYGATVYGEENLSHLALKKNGIVVAAAQVRIMKIPVVNKKIAYVRWGPIWQKVETERDYEVFSQAVRALRNEYVTQRGYILRIRPHLYNDEEHIFRPLLKKEKFKFIHFAITNRTLIKDVKPELDELRSGLKKNWRRHLKKSEKAGLEIVEGTSDELFSDFINIYDELIAIKNFARPNDINEFRLIQKRLPKDLKMNIILCRENEELCAGIICSSIGKTGISLFRATNSLGRKNNGVYLTHWHALKWFKQMQCNSYDLNGINPKTNPGTYDYKAGFCGENGKDVFYLGPVDSYRNFMTGVLANLMDILFQIKRTLTLKLFNRY
jgi:lipid II:glycine glycyltransferase (peptidoglycan interpeptide bridge formation enzyme)